jgi:hypothetical protein
VPTIFPDEKLLTNKRQEGIIEVEKFPVGTSILAETAVQIFEIVVEEGGLSAIGLGKRGFERQKVEFLGSITRTGMLFAGIIVKDMHLVFKLESGQRYTSGCIRAASINSKNYHYELWQE